jgi:serine/threonine protein kinase
LAGQYATAEAIEQDLAELHTLLQAGETSNVMSRVALDAETPSGWADGLISAPSNQKGIEVGQTLGRCLLTEQIGQGATGLVFRAWHQTLNIPVAVKLLQLDCRNNDFVRRQFRTEARLLAQLNHPHVVRIWDFEDAAEQPYLVMEYVEGLTLADLIEQSGRLRLDRAVRIILHVAEALAAGQQLGIVHRDVKPANILLSRDGTAKLADLGLAMFASESSSPPAANQGSVAGTVAYMAPEQAVNAGTIDHRADQYALGGTFYQMLTGRLPFVSRSRMEMILKHANDLPEAPSRIVAELPPQVDHVVARMMAKRPAERYGNYAELIAALSELTSPRCVGPRASASGASSAGSGLWGSLIRKLTGSARASEGPA